MADHGNVLPWAEFFTAGLARLQPGAASPTAAPGFVVPSFDPQELDRRIQELKTVQAWLDVNAKMLATTIQALEVQRNTLIAVQALSSGLGKQTTDFFQQMVPSADPRLSAGESATIKTDTARWGAVAQGASQAAATSFGEGSSAEATTGPASVWLDFLQDQFNRITAAVAPDGGRDANSDAASGQGFSGDGIPPDRGTKGRRTPRKRT